MDGWMDGQTDRQTERQTDKQIDAEQRVFRKARLSFQLRIKPIKLIFIKELKPKKLKIYKWLPDKTFTGFSHIFLNLIRLRYTNSEQKMMSAVVTHNEIKIIYLLSDIK